MYMCIVERFFLVESNKKFFSFIIFTQLQFDSVINQSAYLPSSLHKRCKQQDHTHYMLTLLNKLYYTSTRFHYRICILQNKNLMRF